MPLKNNTSAYQRLKEDIDSRAAQYNQTQEAIYNATHPVSSKSRPKTDEAKRVRQRQLKNMGLYTGEIDGKWGKKSEAAHREALRRGYTYSNGMYSQKPKSMQPIAGKPLTDTQKRQAQLKEMGFYQGKIDDKFGPMSRAAHQKALDAGYTYENGRYTLPANFFKLDDIGVQNASIIPTGGKAKTEETKQATGDKIFYLHYPEYSNHSKNTMPGVLGDVWDHTPMSRANIPVGHDAVILMDKNGKTKYYEYGRINSAPPGTELVGTYKYRRGNVRRAYIPDKKPNETDSAYIARIKDQLPYADAGKLNVSVTGNANLPGALEYINTLANDPNRAPYSLSNTCATFATNVYNGYKGKKEGTFKRAIRTVGDILSNNTPIGIVRNVINHGFVPGIAMAVPNTTHRRYDSAQNTADTSFTIE